MQGDRQRDDGIKMPTKAWRIGAAAATLRFFGVLAATYPASAWAAMWPEFTQIDEPVWAGRVGATHQRGLIPPFRAAARDRWKAHTDFEWRPVSSVTLDLKWEYLWDKTPLGEGLSGPGDLRLGAHAWAWRKHVDLGLGWQVKLPNAKDEGELGSDETDVQLLGTVGRTWNQTRVIGAGGVAILGDPIRFANQDDVAVAWISAVQEVGPLALSTRVGGEFATVRNPARLSTGFGVEGKCPHLMGTELTAGLTPAAPTWGIRAWLGFGGICSDGGGD